MNVVENGLYKVSDSYFSDFADPKHLYNKQQNRPYFLALKGNNGVYWLIPLSSKVEKYRAKIQADEKKHGESVFNHIGKVKNEERAFLIGNVIPVTEEYIVGPFTIGGTPYVVANETEIKAIRSKLRRYLSLVRNKKLYPTVDILGIERKLLSKKKNAAYMI